MKTLLSLMMVFSLAAASTYGDTVYETIVDITLKVPAGESTAQQFEIPEQPSRWAYWVGVTDAYNYLVDVLEATRAVADLADKPLEALLGGKVTKLQAAGSNLDISYILEYWNGASWSCVPAHSAQRVCADSRIVSSRFKEGYYRVKLYNTYSLFTAKKVKIQAVAMYVPEDTPEVVHDEYENHVPTEHPSQEEDTTEQSKSDYIIEIVANTDYDGLHELMDELRELGYENAENRVVIRDDDIGTTRVEWGAAPQKYVSEVVKALKAHRELVIPDQVKLRHTLEETDMRILIVVPSLVMDDQYR